MFHHHFKFNTNQENGNGKKKLFLRPKIILAILLIGIFSLLGVRVYYLVNLAIEGQELAKIESGVKNEENENDRLKYELAQFSSLSDLEKRARELGYTPANNVIFVTGEKPLAKNLETSQTP